MPSNSKEYSHEYYINHKEKFMKTGKMCEICGVEVQQVPRHNRTKKHIRKAREQGIIINKEEESQPVEESQNPE